MPIGLLGINARLRPRVRGDFREMGSNAEVEQQLRLSDRGREKGKDNLTYSIELLELFNTR